MEYFVAYQMESGNLIGEYESIEKLKEKIFSKYPVMSRYPNNANDFVFVFKEKIINNIRQNLGTYCYFLKE